MTTAAILAISADFAVVLMVPLSLARDPEVRPTVSRTQLDRISRILVKDARLSRAFSMQMQRFASVAGDVSRGLSPELAEYLWNVDVRDVSQPPKDLVEIPRGRFPDELSIHANRMYTLFRGLFARAAELDKLLLEGNAAPEPLRAWTMLANYWIRSTTWIKLGGQEFDPRATVSSAIMRLAEALVTAAEGRGTLVSERVVRTEYTLPSLRNREIKEREDAFAIVED